MEHKRGDLKRPIMAEARWGGLQAGHILPAGTTLPCRSGDWRAEPDFQSGDPGQSALAAGNDKTKNDVYAIALQH
jgi:hypothetical protein